MEAAVRRKVRSPRRGVSLKSRTGAHVPVDQKSVPFFKTGKEMRERLNRDGGAPDAGA